MNYIKSKREFGISLDAGSQDMVNWMKKHGFVNDNAGNPIVKFDLTDTLMYTPFLIHKGGLTDIIKTFIKDNETSKMDYIGHSALSARVKNTNDDTKLALIYQRKIHTTKPLHELCKKSGVGRC